MIYRQVESVLTDGEYRQAIKLLTELLNSDSVEDKPFALEFIGVARERNYQRFLAEYPDSEHVAEIIDSDVWSVFANSQYRITKAWKIRGKLRYDDRTSDNGSVQQSFSPGLRLQYQDRKNYFYTELGAIFYTNQSLNFPEVSTDIYYF